LTIAIVVVAFIAGYSVVSYVMKKVKGAGRDRAWRDQSSQDKDSASNQDPNTKS